MSSERLLGRLRVLAAYAAVAALLFVARPTPAGLAFGLSLVALGEALRSWAAGQLVKNRELAVAGPYRYTRNPLYLGRLAIFSGLAIAAREPHGLNWIALVCGWAVFFGYYLPRKERVESARLAAIHGERFERYRRAVPALFPNARPWDDGACPVPWSFARFVNNREHWMVAALLLVALYLLRAVRSAS